MRKETNETGLGLVKKIDQSRIADGEIKFLSVGQGVLHIVTLLYHCIYRVP